MSTVLLKAVLTGKVGALPESAKLSAIAKAPVSGPLELGREGFAGDEQFDRKNHGGPDKAVHHYPFEHYSRWVEEIGPRTVLESPGAFGENLSTCGLCEADVAVGDVFRLGTAVLEVSQGRQPCWKLNLRFQQPDMARRVQTSGRTGWYYRVLEPGTVQAGDPLIRISRRSPEWTLERLWRVLYIDPLHLEELAAMAALTHLPDSWRRYAQRRLETRAVEDWKRRLEGQG